MTLEELKTGLKEWRYFCLRTPDCPVSLNYDDTLGYTTLSNGMKHDFNLNELSLVREITREEVDKAHEHIDNPSRTTA